MLGADNQTSATDTVVRLMNSRTDWWVNFALNGHATTVRGITSDPNGLNGIDNLTIAPNGNGFADFMVTPTTQGTLTINTQAGDDFTYTSYIADYVHVWAGLDVSTVGKVALVKDGPGIQRLTPGAVWTAGYYIYTGGTTVKDGVLDVSTVTSFTPNSPVSIEGGELRLGDSFVGQVFSSVTLKSGYLTGLETIASTSDYDVQDGLATVGLTGAVGLTKTTGGVVTLSGPLTYAGNTDIQAGTLEIAGTATLTTITGSDGALTVCTGASLTAASIQVDTLTIGGAPTHTPPLAATVPEPCSIVLLALAGMMIGWFKFRNR
jgi:autotransporter-associated beta strand protein